MTVFDPCAARAKGFNTQLVSYHVCMDMDKKLFQFNSDLLVTRR